MPDADERHRRRAERNRLANEIAELSARIDAAIYELLVRIRRFDELEGWAGATSYAQWLSWRANLAPGTAREYVRVAHARRRISSGSSAPGACATASTRGGRMGRGGGIIASASTPTPTGCSSSGAA